MTWSDGLWERVGDDTGGFRRNAAVGVNLLSTTDVAWIRYAIGESDVGGARRRPWINFLHGAQDAATGRFVYEPDTAGTHSSGHAFWQAVRCLNILGADLAHFPDYLRPVTAPDGLARWFDAVDWPARGNHHEVLGLVPLLASLDDAEWTEVYYRKIVEQQDPATGTWPLGRPMDISRTFAYTCLHVAAGRMPPMPERIVDAMLAAQQDNGLWEPAPHYPSMDAAYVLIELPARTSHRQAEARAALERFRSALDAWLKTSLDHLLEDTHRTLAVVQSFSLLQTAFPEAYPSARPWRFDWDKPPMFRSGAIARGIRVR